MSVENDIEENKKRVELLKLARHMLNEEYLKDRASAYVQWSTDSDRAWKEKGIKLPFPPTPPMPSEADIVARALDLYNHINAPKQESAPVKNDPAPTVEAAPKIKAEPTADPIVEAAPKVKSSPVVEVVAEPAVKVIAEPVIEPVVEVIAEPVVEPAVEVPAEPIISANITQPSISTVGTASGPADLDVAKTAITEIFNKPVVDPALVPMVPATQSVVPLIKGMLKKGLLPNWIKPDNFNEESK